MKQSLYVPEAANVCWSLDFTSDVLTDGRRFRTKPTQNVYIERVNGSFRRELLDAYLFRSLSHVRQLVDKWRHDYNTHRPHQTLNFMTPLDFK